MIQSNYYVTNPTVIEDCCYIDPNAYLLPATSIGDNTVISPATLIKNSFMGGDVISGPSFNRTEFAYW